MEAAPEIKTTTEETHQGLQAPGDNKLTLADVTPAKRFIDDAVQRIIQTARRNHPIDIEARALQIQSHINGPGPFELRTALYLEAIQLVRDHNVYTAPIERTNWEELLTSYQTIPTSVEALTQYIQTRTHYYYYEHRSQIIEALALNPSCANAELWQFRKFLFARIVTEAQSIAELFLEGETELELLKLQTQINSSMELEERVEDFFDSVLEHFIGKQTLEPEASCSTIVPTTHQALGIRKDISSKIDTAQLPINFVHKVVTLVESKFNEIAAGVHRDFDDVDARKGVIEAILTGKIRSITDEDFIDPKGVVKEAFKLYLEYIKVVKLFSKEATSGGLARDCLVGIISGIETPNNLKDVLTARILLEKEALALQRKFSSATSFEIEEHAVDLAIESLTGKKIRRKKKLNIPKVAEIDPMSSNLIEPIYLKAHIDHEFWGHQTAKHVREEVFTHLRKLPLSDVPLSKIVQHYYLRFENLWEQATAVFPDHLAYEISCEILFSDLSESSGYPNYIKSPTIRNEKKVLEIDGHRFLLTKYQFYDLVTKAERAIRAEFIESQMTEQVACELAAAAAFKAASIAILDPSIPLEKALKAKEIRSFIRNCYREYDTVPSTRSHAKLKRSRKSA